MPDTIAAIATARGQAALAIVRLSGPRAIEIADRCFRGNDLHAADSHTAHVGYFAGARGEAVDQVVAIVFRAPRSATGEHVVEISCHGGDLAPQLVLEGLLARGARMAAPGEFTERAFLNGKLDLAQAEAVADLIHASSRQAHRVSLAHLEGRYSDRLDALRQQLLDLCAYLELELDFSEEDVAFADRERLEALLERAEALLDELLGSYAVGRKLRDGVRVVIGGRPNAGKSTLLNALVGRARAIVHATPGTTRDEVEGGAEIEGVGFRFVDTAGLRRTADAVEAEGVRRAERSIREADVLLYLYDRTCGLDADEHAFLRGLTAPTDANAHVPPVLIVANKSDLVADAHVPPGDVPSGLPAAALSAEPARSDARALRPVLRYLTDTVAARLSRADASHVVMNQRHRQHLREARAATCRARRALAAGASGDLLALDLRAALDALGAITGAVTNEHVLGQIFSRFCIGK